jgi:hypothetical protein
MRRAGTRHADRMSFALSASSPKNFASAIPQLDAQTAEAIRLQFLQALKESIAVRFRSTEDSSCPY